MKINHLIGVVIGLIVFYSLPAVAKTIVLNGIPMVQCKSSIQESSNVPLDESKQNEYRVMITKEGNEYFWETRQKRKLHHSTSGVFHYFIEPNGAGYIKVVKKNGRALYLEHMSLMLETITYWGIAEDFNP